MMARAAVQHLQVHVRSRRCRETLEEILDELRRQVADLLHRLRRSTTANGRPDKIDRGDRERFVHRHHEVAGAIDAALVAERLAHRLAERDADVLDRVVRVDVEIARRPRAPDRSRRAGRRVSSMWSRKRRPVRIRYLPRPSRFSRSANLRFRRLSINSCATQGCPPGPRGRFGVCDDAGGDADAAGAAGSVRLVADEDAARGRAPRRGLRRCVADAHEHEVRLARPEREAAAPAEVVDQLARLHATRRRTSSR